MIKRLVAMSIAIVLILGTVNVIAVPEDVAGTLYENPVMLLSKIGIIDTEDDYFSPYDAVTRGEFAYMAAQASGTIVSINKDNATFSDVRKSNKYFKAIEFLVAMGVVSISDDGKFYPESEISMDEAVKIIVCVLGYNEYAQNMGGYPVGYLMQAKSLGITSGISSQQDIFTKGDAALMIYEALQAPFMSRTVYGERELYSINKDNTLLTERFDIYKSKGRITATEITGLTHPTALPLGKVKIDDKILSVGENEIIEYLGVEGTYFYREIYGADDDELVYFEKPRKLDVINIDAKDIVLFEDNKLYYTHKNSSRQLNYSIPRDVPVIYNAKAVTMDYTEDLYYPDMGGIELVDSDGDNVPEVVKIKNYKNYIIGIINNEDNMIYDKYSASKSLSFLDNSSDKYIIIKNPEGNTVPFEKLESDMVLTTLVSNDGNYIEVYICDDTTVGRVDEVLGDKDDFDSDYSITVSGEQYDVCPEFRRNAKKTITAGDEGVFMLDKLGNIADFRVDRDLERYTYGFIVAGELSSESFDQKIDIKLVDIYGALTVAKCADKVNIDGRSYKNAKAAFEALKTDSSVLQLIRFIMNYNNELMYIDTAKTTIEETGTECLRQIYNTNNEVRYKSAGRNFDGTFTFPSEATAFIMPPSDSLTDATEDEFNAVRASTYFKNDSYYAISAYTSKVNSYLAEIVIDKLGSKSTISIDTQLTVISNITRALNSEGETVTMLKGLRDGANISVEVSSAICEGAKIFVDGKNFTTPVTTTETDPIALEVGDAIQFGNNSKGQVDKIDLIYDESEKKTGVPKEDIRLTHVFKREGNMVIVSQNPETISQSEIGTLNSGQQIWSADRFKITVFDPLLPNNKVKIGTVDSIRDYETEGEKASTLLIQTRYVGEPKTIVVY